MRWPGIEHIYGSTLRGTKVFGSDEDGKKRWDDLHTRVIEHVSFSLLTQHPLKLQVVVYSV